MRDITCAASIEQKRRDAKSTEDLYGFEEAVLVYNIKTPYTDFKLMTV